MIVDQTQQTTEILNPSDSFLYVCVSVHQWKQVCERTASGMSESAKHPGRPPNFDASVYGRRNVVERCVNRLKQWRGIATRYEKRALNYRAVVVIAALMIWLAS